MIKEKIKKNAFLCSSFIKLNAMRWEFKKRLSALYLVALPIKKNKIVFSNFFGKDYGDNPRYICDEFLKRNRDYDLVWILKKGQSVPDGVRVVEYGSKQADIEMASAKLWVFNIRNFPHPKKKKGQVYIQTWHGGGVVLKEMEGMAEDKLSPYYIAAAKADGKISDYILSSDAIRTEVEKKYFWLSDKTTILEYGTPRDDIFFDKKQQEYYKSHIRDIYGITEETKIVLYMPTFRDDKSTGCYDLDYKRIIETFEEKFNSKFILFVRFHPNVAKDAVSLPNDPQIINVTPYPEAYELFFAADFAISDYNSSAICKMPLIKKPSFIYASDFEEYQQNRGLAKYYFELPIKPSTTNEQLVNEIKDFEEKSYFEKWDTFYKKYPSYEKGTSTEQIVDRIETDVFKNLKFD